MTEVLHSPSHFAASPSSRRRSSSSSYGGGGEVDFSVRDCDAAAAVSEEEEEEAKGGDGDGDGDGQSRDQQLSLLALLVAVFRKSLIACKSDRRELCSMEIGWPTNVRHVAHVTFDRFNGFLGLPVEFEPEVPRRPPSASTTVFGVSTESMQLSYDSRGNSVPTILLLMQGHLYTQGGLRAEGIFRINAENSQEEFVRDQLNRGDVPEGIDVHCLAGLIKAWFRELPSGVLDSLSPEQVIQCQTEEECAALVRLLPPTEAALLDWAINLMADVVQHEDLNKMNARNIAMVFAPNMTQMADPLTALMYAVQVMNFLKTLILKTLKERRDPVIDPSPARCSEPYDENGHQSPSQTCTKDTSQDSEEPEQILIAEKPSLGSSLESNQNNNPTDEEVESFMSSIEKLNCVADDGGSSATSAPVDSLVNGMEAGRANCMTSGIQGNAGKCKTGQSSNSNFRKGSRKVSGQQHVIPSSVHVEKTKEISKLSRMESRMELIEAWR